MVKPAGSLTYLESLGENQLVLLGAAQSIDLAFELYPNFVSAND